MLNFIKTHQQKIVLSVGYILVAILGFSLGRISAVRYEIPEIKLEQAFNPPSYDTANTALTQSEGNTAGAVIDNSDCKGKIKGNINSKGEKIYHLPSGSFYRQTQAEACFDTEAQARKAGFRKSSR